MRPLIYRNAQLPQLDLGHLDLAHELFVGLGGVVEGQDAPAEADKQVGAEGDEGPEGQDGDDLGLNDGGEGDQVEVEGKVGLVVRFVSDISFGSCSIVHVAGINRLVPGRLRRHRGDVPSSRGGRWRWSAGRASSCSGESGRLWKSLLVDSVADLGLNGCSCKGKVGFGKERREWREVAVGGRGR